MKAFLDANILFSASLGGPAFALLWELSAAGRVELWSSGYCLAEAERNLRRKRPDAMARYRSLVTSVNRAPEATSHLAWAETLINAKDAPVLAAALRAQTDTLITGDLTHFGPLMERDDLPFTIQTLRTFLLAGPPSG